MDLTIIFAIVVSYKFHPRRWKWFRQDNPSNNNIWYVLLFAKIQKRKKSYSLFICKY